MLKKVRKILISIIITLIMYIIFSNNVNASSHLYLEELDFNVNINEDGSMNVVETWLIDITDTNTLYKDFELDKDKYSSITNVKVKEITDGINKNYTQIDEEMYHVTKDCYYGLKIDSNTFEIAWGVGLDNDTDTRKYEISYTVNDAISKYNDYAELYWQFVGEDFEINAKKIEGVITLPSLASNKDDIKVWGHTEGLNGEIYATEANKIEFTLNHFYSGRYVEIRTLFPTDMITNSNRTYNKDRYEEVVKEETKWANEANFKRNWEKTKDTIFQCLLIIAIIAFVIVYIFKIIKYAKKLSSLKKYTPEQELDYFRELPSKTTTPGEAVYILQEPYNSFNRYYGKIFTAVLLNLKLRKYIDFRIEKNEKNKEKIYISYLKDGEVTLKKDENDILKFIKSAIGKKEEIEVKDLEKYIKSHSTSVERLIKNAKKHIETQLTKEKSLSKTEQEEYLKYSSNASVYYVMTIVFLTWAFPVSIVMFINGILCSKIKKRINVLTQKGINEKEKWKGLKKYMEDFSLLNEKEIPAIEVWEEYLVYATAFGIAQKVLKQLKEIYPNIEELDTIGTSCIYFMYHTNFSTTFSSSINSAISTSYSSATGGGGGFSGGGGGGRRPVEAAEADKKYIINI